MKRFFCAFLTLLVVLPAASKTEFTADVRIADAWRDAPRKLVAPSSAPVAVAGWIESAELHTVAAQIPPAWFIASKHSGWSITSVLGYAESLSLAFARCNIAVARSPLVVLERFDGDAEGAVDARTWDSGVHFDALPKNLTHAVLFADSIKSPYVYASIGGRAVFNSRLPHVIIARHDQHGQDFEPKWTLPHEFAHHLLGPEHDPPNVPATVMASSSCTRCTFSDEQCAEMRRILVAASAGQSDGRPQLIGLPE